MQCLFSNLERRVLCVTAVVANALALSACGDTNSAGSAAATSSVATGATRSVSTQVDLSPAAPVESSQEATPQFHAAPVVLDEPGDLDSAQSDASATLPPHTQSVPVELSNLSTRRLTLDTLRFVNRHGVLPTDDTTEDSNATPLATGSVVATYTPAQIRAAYSLPPLPASTSSITAAQAAQLGAGQTIYIVDAQSDPNVVAELAAFSQKFGLPACTITSIPTSISLPLTMASVSGGCSFSVVYSTASGARSSTAPAYNSGWATEIALDVQWSHATAPLARIILIEAPDASLNSLLGAVELANAMGPGVVSMSFGALEGSWTAQVDSTFITANMTYLAAAGDAGAGVNWPGVSPHVLAIGGTSLTYTGSGNRSETVWSGTGGGVSQYTATPSYQASVVPGMGTPSHRSVTDVSFNADPSTGQYVAVIPSGSASVGWISAGGTSLSTPQWAGVLAVANALRAQASLAAVGAPHTQLYTGISTVSSKYGSDFTDVIQGSDGTCASCYAKVGYDLPTGLGTPNVTALLNSLVQGSTAAAAPVVGSAAVAGTVGKALSFSATVTAAHPVSFVLSNAPTGMTVNSAGLVTWTTPVMGNYSVTVTVTDTQTGLSGLGVYSVTITNPAPPVVAPPQPPTVSGGTVTDRAGVALSFNVAASSSDPLTYMLSGAPGGMSINSSGVVSWSNPIAGNYSVTATATDTRTGLSGRGVYTVTISAAGPTITASSMTGIAGKKLAGSLSFSDSTSNSLSVSISGVPAGMQFVPSGPALSVTWATPVTGTYTLVVYAKDGNGLATTLNVPVTITAH